MQLIAFCLLAPLIYFISLLPLWILFRLSDFVFVLLYYVFRYRRKVVFANLKNSFPNKSDVELRDTERKFYRYLCDLMFEILKGLTITKYAINKRCVPTKETLQLAREYYQSNKSIILVLGHYGNWEWAAHTCPLVSAHHYSVIYHPLANKYFDWMMNNSRLRFGTGVISMKNTIKEMLKNKNKITATAFLIDQRPSNENAYWTTFLNQDTAVFWGAEKMAVKLNTPVVYGSVKRIGRGRYQMHLETICDNPQSLNEGEISELCTRKLEEDIIHQPENWLWSHRRWKRKRTGRYISPHKIEADNSNY